MSQENVEMVEAIRDEFRRGTLPEGGLSDDANGTSRTMSPRAGDSSPIRGPSGLRKMVASSGRPSTTRG